MAVLKRLFWSDDRSSISPDSVREINAQIGEQVYVDNVPIYQDGNGAPIEQASPLGYNVGWFTILFLNVSQMVGTGIFSTPATVLKALDSIGLSIIYWMIGGIIASAGLAVYLEYASLYPNRSGGNVAYLEQAYPRPAFLFPITYAFFTVALSSSSGNAVVLARYIFRAAGHTASEWENKALAMGAYTILAICCVLSTKFSIRIANFVSVVKVIILLFIVATGFAVLSGKTRVPDPHSNFRGAFDDIHPNGNKVVNALVSVNFAYQGYNNGFNLVAEVKRPMHTLKIAAPISLLIVATLYVLTNVAYFAAVPKAKIIESKELTAALFFEAVFGETAKGLPALVAVSSAGNILAVIIGASRQIRECARQGVLPWPHIWVSTHPFGTPIGPIFLKWVMTMIVIVALPFGDAFNFIVDLRSYPDSVFLLLLVVGIYFTRVRRKRQGLPLPGVQVWHAAAVFTILVCLFLLIMPWYPPENGGDVNFWYATYCAVGLGLMAACAICYTIWAYALPKFYGYQIRTETLVLYADGSVTHRLVKVPNGDVEQWDRTHDSSGNVTTDVGSDDFMNTDNRLIRRARV